MEVINMNRRLIKQKVIEAINLRDDLIQEMKNCGIHSDFSDKPYHNAIRGQIAEDAALVIEYYYGLPAKIYTPIGYISITGGYHRETIPGGYDRITKILEEKYGFKLARPAEKSTIGELGPWYSKDGTMVMAEEELDSDTAREIFASLT
jgi:hypothetical protein